MVYLVLAVVLGLGVHLVGTSVLRAVELIRSESLLLSDARMLVSILIGHGLLAFITGASMVFGWPLFQAYLVIFAAAFVLSCTGALSSEVRKRWRDGWRSVPLIYKVLSVLLLLWSANTGLGLAPNLCDDVGRYFYMGQRLWSSGNLADSFNNWRTVVTGGSLYVQTPGLLIPGDSGPMALDIVCGQMIILAMLKMKKSMWSRIVLVLVSILAAVTNSVGIATTNSVPRFVPALLMTGILLTALNREVRSESRVVILLAASSAMAAAGAIRPQFLMFMIVAVVVSLVVSNDRILGMLLVLATPVFLSPWLIASFRDTGTPLFLPFLPGNSVPNWRGASMADAVHRTFLDRFLEIDGLRFLLLAIVLAVAVRARLPRRIFHICLVVLGAALATMATFAFLATANEQPDITRYLAPIVLATIIFVTTEVLESTDSGTRWNTHAALAIPLVLLFGISAGSVGVLDIPGEIGSSLLSAKNRLNSGRDRPYSEFESELLKTQGRSVDQLMAQVPDESNVLVAIDRSELALQDRMNIGILGAPGWVYQKPHDLEWSYGISPLADSFKVRMKVDSMIENAVYPLIEFGRTKAGDLVGVRKTPFGVEFVLDHWGSRLRVSSRITAESISEEGIGIEIDRTRGLIRIVGADGRSWTIGPDGGAFHTTLGPYFLNSNKLGFSTVQVLADASRAVSTERVLRDPDHYFAQLLQGLRKRGVEFLLVQDEQSSRCLYSEAGWVTNATRPNIYQNQAPFMLAWIDFIRYQTTRLPVATNGDFQLLDLRT